MQKHFICFHRECRVNTKQRTRSRELLPNTQERFSPPAWCQGQFDLMWHVFCCSQLPAQHTFGSIKEVCSPIFFPLSQGCSSHSIFHTHEGPLCCFNPHWSHSFRTPTAYVCINQLTINNE